jgi:ketosteroid isomerase-like protein
MKYCPACRSQYSDDTLRFCLQDGAALQTSEVKQSTIDTISFSDPVTADNILKTAEMKLYSLPDNQDKTPSNQDKTRKWSPAAPKSALRQEPKKPKSSAKIWLTVFPSLLAIVAVGLGGWIYLKNQNKESVRFADAATPEIAQTTPPANNSKAVLNEASQPSNSNSELSGSETAKREIADAVELWRQAMEARKVPDYLSRYAEKVDYFDKTCASTTEIRTEAQKMFDTYDDIDINLTNVRVAVDADGKQGTAVFEKEWSYHTAKDLLEGKARAKLRFQKNGSEWKIFSEKYQKIYYTQN